MLGSLWQKAVGGLGRTGANPSDNGEKLPDNLRQMLLTIDRLRNGESDEALKEKGFCIRTLSRNGICGLKLSRCALQRLNLRGMRLTGTALIRAKLSGALLLEADLSESDLRDANLAGADLEGANLTGANLKGANLREAYLKHADLSLANLAGADLTGANLTGARGLAPKQLGRAKSLRQAALDPQLRTEMIRHRPKILEETRTMAHGARVAGRPPILT